MNDLYKAPDAVVADAPRAAFGRPPWPVMVAIGCLVLLVIQYGISTAGVISLRRFFDTIAVLILLSSALILVTTLVAWFLARRSRWARWLLAALAVFHIFEATSKFIVYTRKAHQAYYDLPMVSYAIWAIPVLLTVTATVLVFWPGRAWFKRQDS